MRKWAVTVVYRISSGEVSFTNDYIEAASFWEAIGRAVDRSPDDAQELLSLSCIGVWP